ncbi:MAG: sigma 54-interacting transcriptional regulator [Planctomycetales bacterium]|nr:sigma 54-interacting transcriptional regulator [Planctomycetales bacterium]
MLTTPSQFGLVAINGAGAGSYFPLDPDSGVVTIGRDESRDLPIDDPLASRLHARLTWHGPNWHIEDCESSNGTKVNSESIARAILQPGDLIRIGDRLLVFLHRETNEQSGLTPARLAEATSLFRVQADARQGKLFAASKDSTQPMLSSERLSAVLRFTTTVYAQSNLIRAAKLAAETIADVVKCSSVNVWMTGVDGRLKRLASIGESSDGRLLASVCMERNEAVAYGSDWNLDRKELHFPTTAAPIPGRRSPRGAIECRRQNDSTDFEQADLDFILALAHQLGMAAEIFEHRESLEQENRNLRQRVGNMSRLHGESSAMQSVHSQIQRIAPTSSTVLILGESGTGKELVAHSIHDLSNRAAGPFVAVNCASFNESLLESELFGHEAGAFTGADQRRVGQFERAHRGTIFLDEIGEMTLACQAKLLRLLEGHPFERLGGTKPIQVDIRVVAATHRDLRSMVDSGKFREDLYFRLRVIELNLPPLRERGDDVLLLAGLFLQQFRSQVGRGPKRISKAAASMLVEHSWPGNVRELRNAMERVVVLGESDDVGPEDLALGEASRSSPSTSPLISLAEAEQLHIQRVLAACGGNKTKACKILGIGRGTLYAKLKSSP